MDARTRLIALALTFGTLMACSEAGRSAKPQRRVLKALPLAGVWHKVGQGDTVSGLSRRYRVPGTDIEEINGLERWQKLEVGRELFIPGARRAEGTTTTRPPVSLPVKPAATGRLQWPIRGGMITSRFGKRGKAVHEGIDIAAPEGTAILAAADGTVMYSGSGVKGYGNLVLLRHSGGLVTVYAHNRANLVKESASVQAGQVIAEVGHTGRTSGDHLHFEVRKGDKPVDPLKYVSPPKQ